MDEFGAITENNIWQFREINQQCLAVKYSDNFYSTVTAVWNEFSWFYYASDLVVGAVSARREERNGELGVYIMTCSVLLAYRRRGLARKMMEKLLGSVKTAGISLVFLNVWVASEDAVQFYMSLGFEKVEILEDYYEDIEPKGAYILELRII